jgi:uncharacterized MAPEG superfamily protein
MQIEQATIPTVFGQLPLGTPIGMTVPLWGLVILILWTIAVAILLLTVRVKHLAAGGSIKDFGTPNDGSLLWRLFRVHANMSENLPLYIGVVVLLIALGVSGVAIDGLAGIYILFRLLHSVIHIFGGNPNLRLLSLMMQFGCLIGLIGLAIVTVTFEH